MSEKHLSKGSTCPPLQPGKFRLYIMRFCPYAQRAFLVAAAKKVPFDIVCVNLIEKPEWLFEKNPLGKVPALEVEGGDVIYESLIVADYLDEKYPDPPMYPSDPMQKAKDRLLIESFHQQVIIAFQKTIRSIETQQNLKAFGDGLDQYEKELQSRKSTFYAGSKPGMVDYMMWPWMERSHLAGIMTGGGQSTVTKDRYPKLVAWMAAMEKDEPVKRFLISKDIHLEFAKSMIIENKPKYDIPVPSPL